MTYQMVDFRKYLNQDAIARLLKIADQSRSGYPGEAVEASLLLAVEEQEAILGPLIARCIQTAPIEYRFAMLWMLSKAQGSYLTQDQLREIADDDKLPLDSDLASRMITQGQYVAIGDHAINRA